MNKSTRLSAAQRGHRTGYVILVLGGLASSILLLTFVAKMIRGDNPNPSSSIVAESDTAQTLPSLNSLDIPRPSRQKSGDSLLEAEVTPAQAGRVQQLDMDGRATDEPDIESIDPNVPQAEQGLNDGSGLTFPCVFSPNNTDVCQRKLTQAEATERGF